MAHRNHNNRKLVKNDARFMIMKSLPERYIKTPEAAIVVVVRLIEGIAALPFLLGEAPDLAKGFIRGEANGLFTLMDLVIPRGVSITDGIGISLKALFADIMKGLLPPGFESLLEESQAAGINLTDIMRSFLPSAEADLTKVMAAGRIENLLCAALVIGLMIALAAVVTESVVFIFLRTELKGSSAAKNLHKVIFYAYLAMLMSMIFINGIFVNKCRTVGLLGTLFKGELRTIGIMMVIILVLLTIRTVYHWEAAKVLAAVDHEVRTGFKEHLLEVKLLPACVLTFALIFAAAAVIIVVRTGLDHPVAVLAMVLLSLKNFMVNSCWSDFRLCHM